MKSLNEYGQYVGREEGLPEGLADTVTDKKAKIRGWNTYYDAHKPFLEGDGTKGVWGGIGETRRNEYLEYVNKGLKTVSVLTDDGFRNETFIDQNTDEGKWLAESIKDQIFKSNATGTSTDTQQKLPSAEKALELWSSVENETRKEDLLEHAAKRRMAFEWHNGEGGFDEIGSPGFPPGNNPDRNFKVYSTLEMTGTDGNVRSYITTLSTDGEDFVTQSEANETANNYGQFHWDYYGKNESRILPGSKFSVNENGKITYDKNLVGTGLQETFDGIANDFNNAEAGDYKKLIEGAIASLPDKYTEDIIRVDDQGNREGDINTFDAYYLNNNITKKAPGDYAQPPSLDLGGKGFDSQYYRTETTHGRTALENWKNAQTGVTAGNYALPDLDVVGPYIADTPENSLELFLHGTYTDIKNSGISDDDNRGNEAEATDKANSYSETWTSMDPGDQTVYRDNLLGLTTPSSGSGRPTIDWDEPFVLDSNGNIMYEEDEYGNRTPIVNKEGVSFLETSIFNVFGKKDLEEQDKFQALAFDLLKTTSDKLAQERKRENELNIYKGLPGFNEIYGANSSIANSLIGDSGIGGYLSMAGVNVDSMTESLEKGLSNVTGISNNSSVFNWQKWFDETLLDRYENMEEITGKLKADVEDLDPILNENQWTRFQNQINNREPGTDSWNQLMDANNLPRGVSKERALEIKSPDTWGALLNKYDLDSSLNKEEALEILTGTENEIFKIYTIEDQFRESFIDDFIKPRFDQSKSMDEFISYLDSLDENEQNIFQTQDAMEALKNTASAYASAKLEQIQSTSPQYFDAAFYFDPTTAIDERFEGQKDEDYRRQAERVQADYDAANANADSIIEGTIDGNPNGYTWADYAYYYGVNLADKDQFARLHFDVLGNGKAKDEQGNEVFYDPAKDITSAADIQGYIADTVIPAVNQTKIDLDGAVFSEFTTPEEFADHLLKGIDPTENNPEWKEVLEQFGMEVDASLEEVKDYIIDITRTGAAQEIRETIKYLNEKKLTPTQERIGVSYIEREEDANPTDPEGQTALFQIFSDAGYAGSQDEFFAEFMPDADRGDMELITQAMPGGAGFNLESISSDPFTALSQVGGLLGSSESVFDTGGYEDDDDEEESNYFTLFDEPEDSYSDAGRDYISEYTSFFSS
tara:strand:+ start:181 stop:3651 length:3471 start_codon:yes stop_codon:yes gene_type:complete